MVSSLSRVKMSWWAMRRKTRMKRWRTMKTKTKTMTMKNRNGQDVDHCRRPSIQATLDNQDCFPQSFDAPSVGILLVQAHCVIPCTAMRP